MTGLPELTLRLKGRDAAGDLLDGYVAARAQGPFTRSIGSAGDTLVLIVGKEFWRPADIDISKPMEITFGLADDPVVLGGYILEQEIPGTFGDRHGDESEDIEALEVMLRFVTEVGSYRDGRGGLLQEQTYNPLKADGLVDSAHADFRTNEALANLAMSAIGLDYDVAPASMNVVDPPAPIDWGNCRAIPELDGLCSRTGHTLVLNNAGDTIKIVRLPLAGEPVTIPSFPDGAVQPYELSDGPAIRPTKVIITSGRTRSTILTDRTLDYLEWVWKDSKTGRWLNDAQTLALYSGETKPGDINAFKAAPPKDQTKRAEFKRLFTALRFKSDELPTLKRLVNFPDKATVITGKDIGGEACMVYAKCCVEIASGQFRNVDASGSMIRIDGARAIANEGVFTIPSEAVMVRMNPGPPGGYGNAVALTNADVQILFAHEADTGDPKRDYFVVGYKGEMSGGSVSVTEMTEEELDEALLDPSVPVISQDWFKRLLVWPNGESDPTVTNDADLKAAAQKLAKIRLAGSYAKSGFIALKGMFNIEPGDWSGFVSSVQWDMRRQLTIVSVGQHEVPGGVIDAIAQGARQSFVAGYGRFSLPGSAVELSEVRSGGAPGVLGQVTNAAAPGDARGASATRGSEKSLPTTAIGETLGPSLDKHGDHTRFMARITGNTSLATNRWTYAWEEVYLNDTADWTAVASGRTSATHGVALNGMEAGNTGTGVQGNGIDLANLPAGFAIKPISPDTVHEMLGPFGPAGTLRCHFSAANGVDGECPTEEPPA